MANAPTDTSVPERALLNFDKAGAEWVIVAYFCGDARMIEVVETGQSPHVVTGGLISGASEEIILAEHKLLGGMTDAIRIEEIRRESLPQIFKEELRFLPRIFSIRQMGKKCNHALNYMMKEREFSYQTEMEERDCKKVIQLYLRGYPNIQLWWQSVIRELKDNDRTLVNPFGLKRRFLDEWGNELFKQAIAHLPQSTNVNMVNLGLKKSYMDDSITDITDFLQQGHDSILTQMIIKDWKKVARTCLKIRDNLEPTIEYGGRDFKVGTECKIGKTWGTMKEVKLTNDIDKLAKELRVTWEALNNGKKAA